MVTRNNKKAHNNQHQNAAQAANSVEEVENVEDQESSIHPDLSQDEDILADKNYEAELEKLTLEMFSRTVTAMNTSVTTGNYDAVMAYVEEIQAWAEQSKLHAEASMLILNDGLGMLAIVKTVVVEGLSGAKIKPFRAVFNELVVLMNNSETVNIDDLYVDVFKKEIDHRASKARREKVKESFEEAKEKIADATSAAIEETKDAVDKVWSDDLLRYGAYTVAAVVAGYGLYKAYDYFSGDSDSDVIIVE